MSENKSKSDQPQLAMDHAFVGNRAKLNDHSSVVQPTVNLHISTAPSNQIKGPETKPSSNSQPSTPKKMPD